MIRTEHFYRLVLIMGLCLAVFSCSDEDDIPDRNFPPFILGNSFNVGTDQDTVFSVKTHLSGQSHRSSENFSIKNQRYFRHRNAFIRWKLSAGNENVKFKVKIDKTGTDPEIYNGQQITHGTITPISDDMESHPTKLYIADPEGATQDGFEIYYEVCIPDSRHIYMTCERAGRDSERSSDNIFFRASRYQVVCDPKARFYLRHDKGSQTDDYYIKKDPLQNGSIIPAYVDAFVCGANMDFNLELVPMDNPDYCDWMGRLPDDTPLYKLSIPGTHDSATGNDEIAAGLYKCQNFDFPVQMTDGIRYFDIRLNSDLITHHNGNKSDTTCDMIFGYAEDFLKQHPGETLFFLVTADDNHKFYEAVKDNPILYAGQTLPTLGAARGKVILLSRSPLLTSNGLTSWGIDMYTSWPDDSTGIFGTVEPDSFYVQDRFFSVVDDFGGHDTKVKSDSLKSGMMAANGTARYDKFFFIQYASIAGRVTGHTPWDYAWGGSGIDKGMNNYLDELFGEYEEGELNDSSMVRTGVIVMDFYNRHGEMYEDDTDESELHHALVRRIIDFNFPIGEKIRDHEGIKD